MSDADIPAEADLPTTEEAVDAPDVQDPDIQRSPLALRPCSDCGMMVSKQASTCPKCGRAFHESSFTARQRGEQPVIILVLMSLLGVIFLFASPLVVYRIAVLLAPNVIHPAESEGLAYTLFSLTVVAIYVFAMLACTFLGGAVGRPRMAYITGCFLGLFFGPLGVFAAFGIDKRPKCPQCSTRLNGLAKECPACHARLVWKTVPLWY